MAKQTFDNFISTNSNNDIKQAYNQIDESYKLSVRSYYDQHLDNPNITIDVFKVIQGFSELKNHEIGKSKNWLNDFKKELNKSDLTKSEQDIFKEIEKLDNDISPFYWVLSWVSNSMDTNLEYEQGYIDAFWWTPTWEKSKELKDALLKAQKYIEDISWSIKKQSETILKDTNSWPYKITFVDWYEQLYNTKKEALVVARDVMNQLASLDKETDQDWFLEAWWLIASIILAIVIKKHVPWSAIKTFIIDIWKWAWKLWWVIWRLIK